MSRELFTSGHGIVPVLLAVQLGACSAGTASLPVAAEPERVCATGLVGAAPSSLHSRAVIAEGRLFFEAPGAGASRHASVYDIKTGASRMFVEGARSSFVLDALGSEVAVRSDGEILLFSGDELIDRFSVGAIERGQLQYLMSGAELVWAEGSLVFSRRGRITRTLSTRRDPRLGVQVGAQLAAWIEGEGEVAGYPVDGEVRTVSLEHRDLAVGGRLIYARSAEGIRPFDIAGNRLLPVVLEPGCELLRQARHYVAAFCPARVSPVVVIDGDQLIELEAPVERPSDVAVGASGAVWLEAIGSSGRNFIARVLARRWSPGAPLEQHHDLIIHNDPSFSFSPVLLIDDTAVVTNQVDPEAGNFWISTRTDLRPCE